MGLACRGRAQGGHCVSGVTRQEARGVLTVCPIGDVGGRVAVLRGGGRGKGSRGKESREGQAADAS